MENIIINSKFDNYEIHLLTSIVENHKGIVMMAHGMEEYKERYVYFINKLNEKGYSCIIADMRGHGLHLTYNELGYFSKKKPNKALVLDMESILEYITESYPSTNLYLFAHSMGTVISRNFLQKNSISFKKVILCGAPTYNPLCRIAIPLARIINIFKGKKKAKLLRNLALGPYSKAIENAKTKLDWLSVSESNINDYFKDQYCGFGFKNNGYLALFKLMKTMDKKIINKNIIPPILLISGSGDPVPGFDKGLNRIIHRCNKAGYKDITNIVIDNARHELLNEDNKDESINIIINFLEK
ncbi:MAG: alpha/beta fold hydrolase [Anaeroplasmataceae bacterium]